MISRDRPCLLLGSYEEEPARRNRNSKLPQGTGGSRRGLHDAPIARNLIGRRFPQVRAPNLGVYARALGIRGGLGDRDLLVFVISDSERGTESINRVLQDNGISRRCWCEMHHGLGSGKACEIGLKAKK